MPKWWPWNRTTRSAAHTAAPAQPAEPSWHGLPVLQRTVGQIERTARFADFTADLTTSRNPELTGTLELLSIGHPERMSILDPVSAGAAVPAPTPGGHRAVTEPRTWSASPATVQRALRAHVAPMQRAAEAATPAREVRPVEPDEFTAPPEPALVEAPEPPTERLLPTVVGDRPPGGLSDPPPAEYAIDTPPPSEIPGFTPPVSAAGTAADPDVSPSPSVPDVTAPPVRRIPTVQRAVTDHPVRVSGSATSRPLPVVQRSATPDRADGAVPEAHPTEATPAQQPPSDSVLPEVSEEPTRPTESSAGADELPGATAPLDSPPASPPAPGPPPASPVPVVSVLDRHLTPDATPHATVQRATDPKAIPPAPSASPSFSASAPGIGHETLHGPWSAARPSPDADRVAPESAPRTPSAVQRTTDSTAGPPAWQPPSLPPVLRQAVVTTPGRIEPQTTTPRRPDTALQRATPPPERTAAVTLPSTGKQSVPTAMPEQLPTLTRSLQRTDTAGRPVLLPPVPAAPSAEFARSVTAAPSKTTTETGPGPGGPVLFESRRPMSLQRMFEHAAQDITGVIATPRDAAGPPPPSSHPGEPHRHHAVTVANLQRQEDTEPDRDEQPAPTVGAAAEPLTATPPPTNPPPAGDIEEMVNRLYDPLAARLRAELWLDRERAGLLTDLGR